MLSTDEHLEPYKKDIREMFDRGARVSTDKMSPCAMLESLQLLYPGWYTLPGENDIRTEITRLFGRKKGSYKDDIGSAESENDDETEGRKGRQQSNLPRQYIKPLQELVQHNPTIKPAEALGKFKAALNLPANQTEHDKVIKTKVSSLKRKFKIREKANIL